MSGRSHLFRGPNALFFIVFTLLKGHFVKNRSAIDTLRMTFTRLLFFPLAQEEVETRRG